MLRSKLSQSGQIYWTFFHRTFGYPDLYGFHKKTQQKPCRDPRMRFGRLGSINKEDVSKNTFTIDYVKLCWHFATIKNNLHELCGLFLSKSGTSKMKRGMVLHGTETLEKDHYVDGFTSPRLLQETNIRNITQTSC